MVYWGTGKSVKNCKKAGAALVQEQAIELIQQTTETKQKTLLLNGSEFFSLMGIGGLDTHENSLQYCSNRKRPVHYSTYRK